MYRSIRDGGIFSPLPVDGHEFAVLQCLHTPSFGGNC